MSENNTQLIIDMESNPSVSVYLENTSSYIASDNSDLSSAAGQKFLTKRAIKEYIDNYLHVDNKKYTQYASTSSNIINSRKEFDEENYPISDKPCFMFYNNDLIIDISKDGLSFDKQGSYYTIRGQDILIDKSYLDLIINSFSSEYDGFYISDSNCNGEEETKFINNISFDEETIGIIKLSNTYQYFKTENDEIIYGFIDANNKKLLDIDRNTCMGIQYNNLDNQILNNNEFVHMLNSIHVFLDISNNKINLVKNNNFIYCTILPESPSINDCAFNESDKSWYICKILGIYEKYQNYVYLGDLIYDGTMIVGIKCSDSKLLLNNVNNIDLRIKDNLAYTYSDKTVISVYDKLVQFDVDRIYWDLSGKSGELYLYIDGSGKPWIDTLKPKWVNDIQYYGHYQHYWRCIAKVEKIEDSWVIKEIY